MFPKELMVVIIVGGVLILAIIIWKMFEVYCNHKFRDGAFRYFVDHYPPSEMLENFNELFDASLNDKAQVIYDDLLKQLNVVQDDATREVIIETLDSLLEEIFNDEEVEVE